LQCFEWIYTNAVVYFFHDDGREKRLRKTAKLSIGNCSGVLEDDEEDFDDAGDVSGRCGYG
jgi:hypothetical protein